MGGWNGEVDDWGLRLMVRYGLVLRGIQYINRMALVL